MLNSTLCCGWHRENKQGSLCGKVLTHKDIAVWSTWNEFNGVNKQSSPWHKPHHCVWINFGSAKRPSCVCAAEMVSSQPGWRALVSSPLFGVEETVKSRADKPCIYSTCVNKKRGDNPVFQLLFNIFLPLFPPFVSPVDARAAWICCSCEGLGTATSVTPPCARATSECSSLRTLLSTRKWKFGRKCWKCEYCRLKNRRWMYLMDCCF